MIDVEELLHKIAVNKERLVEAWIAETGVSPAKSCLVQQQEGLTYRFWVETRTDRCMTHRDELKLLEARIMDLRRQVEEARKWLEWSDLADRLCDACDNGCESAPCTCFDVERYQLKADGARSDFRKVLR
jgi:hypothetical protein